MTNNEIINFLNQVRKILLNDKSWLESTVQPINEAFDRAISALQAQDVPDTNVGDMVSRQKAIDALCRRCDLVSDDEPCTKKCNDIKILKMLPSTQPEPSIPISWIEKQIDWLKSIDNEFSKITAMNISTLVKKWRKENGKDDGSD